MVSVTGGLFFAYSILSFLLNNGESDFVGTLGFVSGESAGSAHSYYSRLFMITSVQVRTYRYSGFAILKFGCPTLVVPKSLYFTMA